MKRLYLPSLVLIIMVSGCSVTQSLMENQPSQLNITLGDYTSINAGFSPSFDHDANTTQSDGAPIFITNSEFIESSHLLLTDALEISVKIKAEKDSTESEPKLEPMVIAGTGLVIAGLGAAAAGVFVTPILFAVAALLFAASAFLTARGWRKIKDDPKKFKGEKFALANYLIIGIVGVLSSFYLIWLLFDV